MSNAGVAVVDLAARCDISVSYMSRIHRGESRLKRNPALRRRIANALNVPIDWIEARETASAA